MHLPRARANVMLDPNAMRTPPMEGSTMPRSHGLQRALALVGTLISAGVAGCGGLAASPVIDEPAASEAEPSAPEAGELEESSDVPDEASEEMPLQFDVLDLRRLYETPAAAGFCEYAQRIKVSMVSSMVITASCNPADGGVTFSSDLAAGQLDAVQQAYLQVRASSAGTCTSRDLLTLEVKTGRARGRRELLFADDDHATCPAPTVPSTQFVSGLSELFADLAQLFGV
jgi:hypothetical protein